jgi:hypothetical protein
VIVFEYPVPVFLSYHHPVDPEYTGMTSVIYVRSVVRSIERSNPAPTVFTVSMSSQVPIVDDPSGALPIGYVGAETVHSIASI